MTEETLPNCGFLEHFPFCSLWFSINCHISVISSDFFHLSLQIIQPDEHQHLQFFLLLVSSTRFFNPIRICGKRTLILLLRAIYTLH